MNRHCQVCMGVPVSQCVPVYPDVHAHENPNTWSLQMAPWRQGEETHSSTSDMAQQKI